MAESDRVSIQDLAESVGLSAATVSRVLNNRTGIGRATRQRVMQAARQVSYRPRVGVRQTTIGVVMDQIPDSVATGIGLVESLSLQVSIALARHRLVVEIFTRENLDALSRRMLDGILAIAWEEHTIDTLLSQDHLPIVIFNRPEYPQFSQVLVDEKEAGRIVARHLIEYGHQRVGVVGAGLDSEATDRISGFREVLEEAGLELPEYCIGMTHFQSPVYGTVQRLYRTGITALFVVAGHLSLEVPYLCSEAMDLRVPEDLSIVGVNVSQAMKFYRPPMTLISPPVAKMADAAVAMLEQMIRASDRTPRVQTIMPELIARDSVTGPRAGA